MSLILNEKHLNLLSLAVRKETRLITMEGTTRSSKTATAVQAFFYRVCLSEGYLQLIAGQDYNAIFDNLLDGDMGLLKLFPSYCSVEKERIGGNFLRIDSPKGRKKVLLAGYSDAGKWAKILGKSIDTILVDEVNTANRKFIDECFARQSGFNYPLTIWTLNGDEPSKWIYTDYINKSNILWECPTSVRAEMDKQSKISEWYYTHWKFKDNPIMTAKKIEAAERIYPVGSFYYTTKILGERGCPGEHIYVDYLEYDKHVKLLAYERYNTYTIGVDIGATKAMNSISLVGFKNNYAECAVLDKKTFKQCGYKEKTAFFIDSVVRWISAGCNIECVLVDSAEQNYIADLKAEFTRLNLPSVIGSYKATIKERIDLVIILLSRGKMLFNDTNEGRNSYKAFLTCKWAADKKGEVREDLNEWHNDVVDSVEYALTRHMKKLLMAKMEA